jgi:hypothetical protein
MVAACSLWAGLSFPSAWAGGLTDPVLSSRVVDFVSIPVDSPLFLPALVPLLFDLVFPFFCLADLALSLC